MTIYIQQNEETTMKDNKSQNYLTKFSPNDNEFLLNKLDKCSYNVNNYELFEVFEVRFMKRRKRWKVDKEIFLKISSKRLLNSKTFHKYEPDKNKKFPNQFVTIFHVPYSNTIYYIKIVFIKSKNLIKVLSAHKK